MDKKSAKKWAVALRSGEYEQCTHELEDDGKYCCLGVAAVVLDLKDHGCLIYPSDAEIMSKEDESAFIIMNDREGKSFFEIADKVEEMYLQDSA